MSHKKPNRLVVSAGLAAVAVLVPAVGLFACGGGAKPADSPGASSAASASSAAPGAASAAPTDSASAAPAAASASAAPADSAKPLGAVLITDASAVQKLFDASAAAPAATSKADGMKGGSPIVKGIKELAAKAAPGMTPEGPLQTATLKEKGHAHAEVTLSQGKCYALVGFSPTVKDLDVHLMLPPGILSAQDETDDNKPVVGKAPDALCPSASTAITYKVDIFADQGAGDAGVQLYSKVAK